MSHQAIELYFRGYRSLVFRWALLLCRDRDEALEVVQDVFLRMVQHPPHTGMSVPLVLAWLRTTTQRLVIDRWRSKSRTPATQQYNDSPDQPRTTPEPEDVDRVRAALVGLSAQQRLVLLARVCDGHGFAQIARDLGLSPSTVKTHYLRGLQALKQRMGTSDERNMT